MKSVLITGANGNVGSRLVKEYLGHAGYKIFALVRGDSREHAVKRMSEALDFWGVRFSEVRDRLEIVNGDVCQENLGLDQAQIHVLREQVNLVVHAASSIRLNLSLEDARKAIVGGTKNTLALAMSFANLERFGFVSSMEVVGDYESIVYEEFLTNYKRKFLNTYEIAKSEAEEFLRTELEAGAPASIFRLSMVVGEAATGKALGFQSFYMMIEKLLLQPDYPLAPRGCPVDTIPVDVLAESIMKLMEYPQATGQVYHLSQGLDDRVSFFDFLDKVQPLIEKKWGKTIKRPSYISPALCHAILTALSKLTFGKLKKTITIQLIFIKFGMVSWQFDNRKTRKTLESLGLRLPSFDEYLPQLLDYYLDHRHLNRLPF